MDSIDLSIFYTVFGLSGRTVWFDWLIVFVGEYLLYFLLFVVVYYALSELRARHIEKVYGYCIAVFAALIARFAVAETIRLFYHRPRPFIALRLPHLLTDYAYSFPSGHTIFLFALATAMLYVNKKLAYCIYALGVIIGLARVAGGVHYPSDIVGGAVLGICTGYIVVKAWKYLSRYVAIPAI